MTILEMYDEYKKGNYNYINELVKHYFPKFYEKAKKEYGKYVNKDIVKYDIENIIIRFDHDNKTTFLNYMSYKLSSYPFKERRLNNVNKNLESLDPLDVIEVDEYYTNVIYRKISLLTNVFTKEELYDLSQMMYFSIKDNYYKNSIKCDFTIYINITLEDKFKIRTINSKDIMIAIYYVKYLGITSSVKEYFKKLYIELCKKNGYVFKEKDFNIFIEEELPIYTINMDVIKRINKFIEKRKIVKDLVNEEDEYSYLMRDLYDRVEGVEIDKTLLTGLIIQRYDEAVNVYTSSEHKSTMRRFIGTTLENYGKDMIENEGLSKEYARMLIDGYVGSIPKDKLMKALEEKRLYLFEKYYVEKQFNPRKRFSKFMEENLEKEFSKLLI